MEETRFRALPAVHRLLASAPVEKWLIDYARGDVLAALQETVDALRARLRDGETLDLREEAVLSLAYEQLLQRTALHLRPVINATGTVLHTNLGRAPLAEEAIAAIVAAARGYSNLEYDLASGERGHRHDHIESLLCELTGAEAALVVNNNAAAVFLVLHELAAGKRVVISRGEMVEIGGSFRVSEVMRHSGATLVEVGTTNKTHERDYETALRDGADLVLRVHTSNFRIVGFAYQPPLEKLVELAHAYGVPLFEDLGSGSLVDLRAQGVGDEPTVRESIEAGVDLVAFSGDKLLGGAQAGIICGRKEWVARIKKNQLARAVRVDKLTLAALEATLRLYRDEGQAFQRIPTLAMLTRPLAELRAVAEQLARDIELGVNGYARCRVFETDSQVGGGALPLTPLPTCAVALVSAEHSPTHLAELLRQGKPAIIARIAKEEVILDVRTIFPFEFESLVAGIRSAVCG